MVNSLGYSIYFWMVNSMAAIDQFNKHGKITCEEAHRYEAQQWLQKLDTLRVASDSLL